MQYLLQEAPFPKEVVMTWAKKIWDSGLPLVDDVITLLMTGKLKTN
jgi:hypothetical protein